MSDAAGSIDAEGEVSRPERIALISFCCLFFILFAGGLLKKPVEQYNESVVEDEYSRRDSADGVIRPTIRLSHGYYDTPAGLHLTTFFILLSLIKARRFFIPAILIVLYATLLAVSIYARFPRGPVFDAVPGDFRLLLVGVLSAISIWDYVGGFFILVMIFWLFTIFIRIHGQSATHHD